MSSKDLKPKEPMIPSQITHPRTNKVYTVGHFLGKGGFARVYEVREQGEQASSYALKVVAKSVLKKQHQKDKMVQEINIHQSIHHKHVVNFFTSFEDKDFVYILLELCRRKSLMELHKRRKQVTEIEAKFFIKQIAQACLYLHDGKIIHRDLKLGNLFLNDDLCVKIGDFGLATRLDSDNDIRMTLCGTPNYIAPEILDKKGHTYAVDCWSLGCILYTLLIGKPPFETHSLRETYKRIKENDYTIPPTGKISPNATDLIRRLLHPNAAHRPSMRDVLNDSFLLGELPPRLPISCLETAPRHLTGASAGGFGDQENIPPGFDRCPTSSRAGPSDYHLQDLIDCLGPVTRKAVVIDKDVDDNAEYPRSCPVFWISKWVDYSDKYGLGYMLCDNSVGVLFNDQTRMLLLENGDDMQYITRDGSERYHKINHYPHDLGKKVTLLKYFQKYMNDHLLKAGAGMVARRGDEMARLPHLRTWIRTQTAIAMHLSNGTVQVNFFTDHVKVIVCPIMTAVTVIDENRQHRTYSFDRFKEMDAISTDLHARLTQVMRLVQKIQSSRSQSSGRPRGPPSERGAAAKLESARNPVESDMEAERILGAAK